MPSLPQGPIGGTVTVVLMGYFVYLLCSKFSKYSNQTICIAAIQVHVYIMQLSMDTTIIQEYDMRTVAGDKLIFYNP